MNLRTSSLLVLLSLVLSYDANAQFSNVATITGLNLAGSKDGGMAWADINEDGCPDLIVNTNDNTLKTRIYFSDCNLPNPTFTDVTATHCPACLDNKTERSIIFGDLNHDGHVDFARNTSGLLEIYGNKGPTASPPYSFGDENDDPHITITGLSGGFNSEGIAFADYNQDGWLDLFLENHNFGIDLLQNPADCSMNFFHNTPNSDPKGLPTSATDGDYLATADFNDDGYVDMLARKRNQNDLYKGIGNAFSLIMNIDQADNGNKGGVAFCDFDQDGDFDLFWTDAGTTQIWEQTGLNSENFVPTGEPAASSGVLIGTNIDGCGCADVDNDGDLDLFVGSNSGTSFLFENRSTPGNLSFVRDNKSINVGGNCEGVAFEDYDLDGDMDLYVNKHNAVNQLWRNGENSENYLFVEPLLDLEIGLRRADHGATVILYDETGTQVMTGIRDVRGSYGHGSQNNRRVHLGLKNGPDAFYKVVVKFSIIGGHREIYEAIIKPSDLPNQTLTIVNSEFGIYPTIGCAAIFLPIELLNFDGYQNGYNMELEWSTATESGSSHFEILRSQDGINFDMIGSKDALGESNKLTVYSFVDREPLPGTSYYRLRMVDTNGSEELSSIIAASYELESLSVRMFPNPVQKDDEFTNLVLNGIGENQELNISIHTLSGEVIYTTTEWSESSIHRITIDNSIFRRRGIYLVVVQDNEQRLMRKLMVE